MNNSFKVLIKDIVSCGAQRLGLPHNRTSKQIVANKKTFNDAYVEKNRVLEIAQATGKSEHNIQEYLDELQSAFWNELHSSRTWNERGGSMMSFRDRTTLYALVRALHPMKIVETGVAGGASSTYILYALRDYPASFLTSIDIESDKSGFYGELIPMDYRSKWKLCLQKKEPILDNVLREIGSIDFFLHDSRHTVHHMTWEYELAWHYLKNGGCLASHDIVVTSAFDDFASKHQAEIAYTGRVANFGFFVKK